MIKSTTHIIFSFIILMLSIGINLNSHYSKGKFYSVSLYGEPETCGAGENEVCEMQMMSDDCEMHGKKDTESNTGSECCENTSEYLHFDVDYTVPEKLGINVTSEKEIFNFFGLHFDNFSIQPIYNHTQNKNIGNSPPDITDKISFLQVFKC